MLKTNSHRSPRTCTAYSGCGSGTLPSDCAMPRTAAATRGMSVSCIRESPTHAQKESRCLRSSATFPTSNKLQQETNPSPTPYGKLRARTVTRSAHFKFFGSRCLRVSWLTGWLVCGAISDSVAFLGGGVPAFFGRP